MNTTDLCLYSLVNGGYLYDYRAFIVRFYCFASSSPSPPLASFPCIYEPYSTKGRGKPIATINYKLKERNNQIQSKLKIIQNKRVKY